jgi:TolA-binding protein
MFRRSFVPCICLAAVLGLASLTIPGPAMSQDLSTQERLDRLERDLNMLQRQVYRGAPPQSAHADGAGAAVNAEVRMDRIEAQMRDLTGHVEEVANQVDQIRQRVEQMNSDVELRFNQPGAGPGPIASGGAVVARPEAGTERSARRFPPPPPGLTEDEPPARSSPGAAASLMPPGTLVPPPDDPNGGSIPAFGTLTPPGSPSPPAGLASAAASTRSAAGGLLPSGSETEQYYHAFGLLKKAD